jgi:hypothetical protein
MGFIRGSVTGFVNPYRAETDTPKTRDLVTSLFLFYLSAKIGPRRAGPEAGAF